MNETLYSVGPIMKAARKFKKLNQADVANAIGCSQSALSKMEHNLLIPSAPQWFLFSRFTSIPPETLESGIIDRHSIVKFNNDQVSLGFKIPKIYRNFRAGKVREIYPFIEYLEKKDSAVSVDQFIESTGLDKEFFLDFDNLTNFQLFADMIAFFIKAGRNSPEEIKEIVQTGQNGIYWDHYGIEWKKLTDVAKVLEAFTIDQMFFQADFQLKLEQNGSHQLLSFFPEFHLKQFADAFTKEMVEFLNYYRKYTIENLIRRVLNKEATAEVLAENRASPLGARFDIKT